MSKAMSKGEGDPARLAALAKGQLKAKYEQLVEALDGQLNENQRWMLGRLLEQVGGLDLARMRVWLERAMGGERQVVFVTGEAGIGKTTLVEAFLRRVARDAGVWIALGQCLERYDAGCGESEAFFPVLEAVSRLCQEEEREKVAGLLRRRAPTWLQQMPWLAGAAEHEAFERDATRAPRERMLREMAETLEALTTGTTIVLALYQNALYERIGASRRARMNQIIADYHRVIG